MSRISRNHINLGILQDKIILLALHISLVKKVQTTLVSSKFHEEKGKEYL